jgi:RNA-directed DNA polymerase
MNLTDLLARKLPLSPGELQLLITTAPNRYKLHTIEKRHNRGKRLIAQPTAEVKIVQKLLQGNLQKILPIHENAKAYRLKTSIKDHAEPHAKQRYLLKIDFENFFPSITSDDFSQHLSEFTDLNQNEIKELCQVFFWRPKGANRLVLAIGAPSSPWLSNTILYDFDFHLSNYCQDNGIIYTRYADDLALSTNTRNILEEAFIYVRTLCANLSYPQLTINEDKTVFTSKKFNRTLTGLVLSNDGSVSIGRDKKREVRALANYYSRGLLEPEKIAHLRGLLAFTLSIDRTFNTSIKRMLGQKKYEELMAGPSAYS